jgi:molybdenum cofactor biosynthesis enzyme MoaA
MQNSPVNERLEAASQDELQEFRQGKWTEYSEWNVETRQLGDKSVHMRCGLTFTPFANPVSCNAHCSFCSEELMRSEAHVLTSKRLIRDYPRYFAGLEEAWRALAGFPMGLSLSGLEATAEPVWLARLLELLGDMRTVTSFQEKVLYTNGSGLARDAWIGKSLADAGFDRIELSRAHYNESANQRIMRFNRNEPVMTNDVFLEMIGRVGRMLPVKCSCILTRGGVNSVDEVERHLDWLAQSGVQTVVFRELSRLDGGYLPNDTSRWVEANRVEIDPLLKAVCSGPGAVREGWSYLHSVRGYYYYNEHYRYQDRLEVILETSSYSALMKANQTGVVHKLVYHSNGNLCGDWDPDAFVLASFQA